MPCKGKEQERYLWFNEQDDVVVRDLSPMFLGPINSDNWERMKDGEECYCLKIMAVWKDFPRPRSRNPPTIRGESSRRPGTSGVAKGGRVPKDIGTSGTKTKEVAYTHEGKNFYKYRTAMAAQYGESRLTHRVQKMIYVRYMINCDKKRLSSV